jgi:tellurite resistance protein TerC
VNIIAATGSSRDNFAVLDVTPAMWLLLFGIIIVLLLVDLLVFHRRAHTVHTREAAIESSAWIAVGLAFGLLMWWVYGGQAAGEYYTGYVIEKSLSVDNVFVWALIFAYFAVPGRYQHRVLFWGIFGALLLRLVFIFAGVALIEQFDWILYVFGAFLVFTGIRLLRKHEEVHPERNPVLKLVRRVIPVSNEYDGQKLFTKQSVGDKLKLVATPLFAVLILIEATDVIFAVDSVPAVLAVSREQYIVFASNAFAILGLRALYFLLADMHARFTYLQQGLAVILVYVGIKMLISEWYHIPTPISLGFIAVVLTVAIILSMRRGKRDPALIEEADRREAAEPAATDGEAPDGHSANELASERSTEPQER